MSLLSGLISPPALACQSYLQRSRPVLMFYTSPQLFELTILLEIVEYLDHYSISMLTLKVCYDFT